MRAGPKPPGAMFGKPEKGVGHLARAMPIQALKS